MRNTLIDNPQGYYFSNRLGGIQTYHFLLVLQLLTKWKRKLKQKMLFPLLAPLGAMNLLSGRDSGGCWRVSAYL